MSSSFVVRTTSRFDRQARALRKRHPGVFTASYEEAITILSEDPYNRRRRHRIKKLEGVRQGDGQYRLRLGRWRFRYDIYGQEVVFHSRGLRREETYH